MCFIYVYRLNKTPIDNYFHTKFSLRFNLIKKFTSSSSFTVCILYDIILKVMFLNGFCFDKGIHKAYMKQSQASVMVHAVYVLLTLTSTVRAFNTEQKHI